MFSVPLMGVTTTKLKLHKADDENVLLTDRTVRIYIGCSFGVFKR